MPPVRQLAIEDGDGSGLYDGTVDAAQRQHGQGTLAYSSATRAGSSYKGSWTHGQRHGYGVYTRGDGAASRASTSATAPAATARTRTPMGAGTLVCGMRANVAQHGAGMHANGGLVGFGALVKSGATCADGREMHQTRRASTIHLCDLRRVAVRRHVGAGPQAGPRTLCWRRRRALYWPVWTWNCFACSRV